MYKKPCFQVRSARLADLPAINSVITSAVTNWPMPQRVKRLAVPSLTYDETDIEHLDLFVCVWRQQIVGVLAWDNQFGSQSQGLVHGLYVLPIVHGQGIGQQLIDALIAMVSEQGVDQLHVRAERVSASYFKHLEFDHQAPRRDNDYPYRFVKDLPKAA